ncbi:MAG: hypothetical protein LBL66_05790 [Clostridiales bacterium]|nr:hypothetical protein [Clostridiales bacterium]
MAQNALLLCGSLQKSFNDYDWLGNGVYFWENDPLRALEWAVKNKKKNPAVIGAVIDLGCCLSLLERGAVKLLQSSYAQLLNDAEKTGLNLPKNTAETHGHKLIRRLDCAVFEKLHETVKASKADTYDTVIGAFMEGRPAYEGTEIAEQSHIQICVRNIECIKGYFLPLGFEEEKRRYLKDNA